ncbi:pyridine nucleotide-disulfide oxidoreductase [Sphingomonas sp. DBB INV C78]|uniref:FAD/NAD(P)-dependent oxidoreductase n=1 Tax=Sphingomonas sp. DBB INV C78 TaxID=3349434 RepID=UPI0036D38299
MADAFDLVIIGGGPAGQAAALALDGHGLSIAVVDEQLRPGGQILRQPPATFRVANWLPGKTYDPLKAQLARFAALDSVEWLGGHSAIGLLRDGEGFAVQASGPEGARRLATRRVLVAAGCQDLAVPLPGWTLPGVYAAGGIQAFVKSQQIVPGERVVLAGTHPLMLMIAAQIVAAGGTVASVLFAQDMGTMVRSVLARTGAALGYATDLMAAAGAMMALRRAGVPVRFGVGLEAVLGDTRVTAVRTSAGEIACDAVGLCYGFVPQSALPRMAGARVRPAGPAGGWAVLADEWMESSIPGLFVAGETTGVAGAPAAMAAGELAGIGIARKMGLIDATTASRSAGTPRRAHADRLEFAALLDAVADPTGHLPRPAPDTIACRCEDVTFAAIDAEIAGGGSANAVKLVTRCGMGPCQGRNCEPTLLRRIGRADDPGFTQRFPARPVTIGDLAGPA